MFVNSIDEHTTLFEDCSAISIGILISCFSSHTLTTRRGILMDMEIQCPVLSLQYIQHMVVQMTDFKVLKQFADAVCFF